MVYKPCLPQRAGHDQFHLQSFFADVEVDLRLAYSVYLVEEWHWNQYCEGYILSYVFRYLQGKLVSIGGSDEEVETFQAGTYGVADGVCGSAPSLDDARDHVRILLGVDAYPFRHLDGWWKLSKKHFEQYRKIQVFHPVFLSCEARQGISDRHCWSRFVDRLHDARQVGYFMYLPRRQLPFVAQGSVLDAGEMVGITGYSSSWAL